MAKVLFVVRLPGDSEEICETSHTDAEDLKKTIDLDGSQTVREDVNTGNGRDTIAEDSIATDHLTSDGGEPEDSSCNNNNASKPESQATNTLTDPDKGDETPAWNFDGTDEPVQDKLTPDEDAQLPSSEVDGVEYLKAQKKNEENTGAPPCKPSSEEIGDDDQRRSGDILDGGVEESQDDDGITNIGKGEATENEAAIRNGSESEPGLVRLLSKELTLLERVKLVLEQRKISGVQWSLTEDNIHVAMFIADDGRECEEIINKLSVLKVGIVNKSSVSIFPANISIASIQEEEQAVEIQNMLEKEDKFVEKVEEFKKTIKSKLVIQQVIKNVEADAVFSFDYLMLIILASFVALIGLLEASSVVLVASMLISPLMGPILAGVLGVVIKNFELLMLGIKSELKGLAICIVVGLITGLIPAGLEAAKLEWRATDSWPTPEMSSRGVLRALPVGILIAIPSGAGVALSVLGGKIGSLVGVAISASLLPPAVNAGVLWANALLVVFIPPESEEKKISLTSLNLTSSQQTFENASEVNCPSLLDNAYTQSYNCNMALESLVLGVVSLFLTLLNILCIIVMGVIVLKIKEVSPLPSAPDVEQEFYGKTLKIARDSYQTSKGKHSLILRDQFLQEYKAVKGNLGIVGEEGEETEEELDQIMEDVEDSTDVTELLKALPRRSNRWSNYWSTSPTDLSPGRPYKTVHMGETLDRQRGSQTAPVSPEMKKLKYRRSTQLVLPHSPTSQKSNDEQEGEAGGDKDKETYFTIHRYVPPSQMYGRMRSPRLSSSGALNKLIIPTVSRFQIAKVEEKSSKEEEKELREKEEEKSREKEEENEKEDGKKKKSSKSNKLKFIKRGRKHKEEDDEPVRLRHMPTIVEQESAPLVESQNTTLA